jgi:hypothetical protein
MSAFDPKQTVADLLARFDRALVSLVQVRREGHVRQQQHLDQSRIGLRL